MEQHGDSMMFPKPKTCSFWIQAKRMKSSPPLGALARGILAPCGDMAFLGCSGIAGASKFGFNWGFGPEPAVTLHVLQRDDIPVVSLGIIVTLSYELPH